jgi:hypothetical protein
MLKQRLMTFGIVMPTLTLGAAGVVTAFNGLPELHV